MQLDPEEKLAAFAADEGQALESMFRRSLGDPELARDLAQETLLRAWTEREKYDPARPLRAWVFSIGFNLLRNHLRRRKVERAHLEELERTSELATRETPTARLRSAEAKAELERSLLGLPEDQREVVLLRYQEGLSCQEIAEVIGVTANAVSIRLYRARTTLRDVLSDPEEPDEHRGRGS